MEHPSLEKQRAQAEFGTGQKIFPELGFDKEKLRGRNIVITGGASGVHAGTRAQLVTHS